VYYVGHEKLYLISGSNYIWGSWGSWMACTENCGLGKRSRFRKQIMPASTKATKKQKTIKNIVDIVDLKTTTS
jgi:hypothetical protein